MNRFLLITLFLLTALNADVSICTDKLETTNQYIECLKKEVNNSKSIEDINFLAGYLVTKNRFDEAINFYKQATLQDDAKAMYYLGGIYEEQKKEYDLAVKWFKKAADKNYKDSVFRVGSILEKKLLKEDEAIAYYQEWIKKGNVEAYNYLGNLYLDKEDFQKAKKEYLKGAKKASKESYYLLGSLHEAYIENGLNDAIYYYKEGAELGEYKSIYNLAANYDKLLEYKKAEPWYKKSMALGNKDAYDAYGYMLAKKGDAKEALEIFQRLANLNDSRGYIGMARVYVNEYKDYENEKKYALKAIELGDADGAVMIGYMYSNHLNDKEKAIKWYTKAYEMKDCDGTENLAFVYRDKYKDNDKYLYWMEKAFNIGCSSSGHDIGTYYLTEKKDIKTAMLWYEKAANLGYMSSAKNLAILYKTELDNNDKAIYWYKRADRLGYKGAKKQLKKLEAQK
ncbi:tetratricopeptide repeat protein [Sulfurimonas sp.]|uniref:tetratricopeptide repeat protein n=1 Tax=Sulfurimonas sp. TaxID=2022749 RepID=UPI002B4A40DD|nr:tetratricopeptide repeat protein [Sulfurimonas sp.]